MNQSVIIARIARTSRSGRKGDGPVQSGADYGLSTDHGREGRNDGLRDERETNSGSGTFIIILLIAVLAGGGLLTIALAGCFFFPFVNRAQCSGRVPCRGRCSRHCRTDPGRE